MDGFCIVYIQKSFLSICFRQFNQRFKQILRIHKHKPKTQGIEMSSSTSTGISKLSANDQGNEDLEIEVAGN